MAKTAHVVIVEEIYRRQVIIYSNEDDDMLHTMVEQTANDLCDDGIINLDFDDFQERNCKYQRKATENDLRLLSAYNK